jgi:hypothetical protein
MKNNWSEFFSDDFILPTTGFESFAEFQSAWPLSMRWTTECPSCDYFIIESTHFLSWEDMELAAWQFQRADRKNPFWPYQG